jgi:hypothetical protein
LDSDLLFLLQLTCPALLKHPDHQPLALAPNRKVPGTAKVGPLELIRLLWTAATTHKSLGLLYDPWCCPVRISRFARARPRRHALSLSRARDKHTGCLGWDLFCVNLLILTGGTPLGQAGPYPLAAVCESRSQGVLVNGLRGRGTRTWHACGTREQQRGSTLSITLRVPPRPAVVHHAGRGRGGAKAARPGRAAVRDAPGCVWCVHLMVHLKHHARVQCEPVPTCHLRKLKRVVEEE